MIVKCKCGKELQLLAIDKDVEIYDCPNMECKGQVIVKGDMEIQ